MNSTTSVETSALLRAMAPPMEWSPWYYTSRLSLLPNISDEALAIMSPIVSYWVLSLFFHLLDNCSHYPPFSWMGVEKYRIHESEEMKSKNKATQGEVLRAVILQQVIQTAMGTWWLSEASIEDFSKHTIAIHKLTPSVLRYTQIALGDVTARRLLLPYGQFLVYSVYWWIIPSFQILLAFFVIDTWQYFLHRGMHMNKFLYKHLHSVHHRLYVPYAYGALYNHPLEGFLLDTCGAVIAEAIAHLSVRQSCLLFAFSSAKTVDDHCGFSLPWDPLQFLYKNNARYHDIHHQHYGLKYNFSQPFWIHWDILLGTRWDKPQRPLAAEKRALAALQAAKEKDGQAAAGLKEE